MFGHGLGAIGALFALAPVAFRLSPTLRQAVGLGATPAGSLGLIIAGAVLMALGLRWLALFHRAPRIGADLRGLYSSGD